MLIDAHCEVNKQNEVSVPFIMRSVCHLYLSHVIEKIVQQRLASFTSNLSIRDERELVLADRAQHQWHLVCSQYSSMPSGQSCMVTKNSTLMPLCSELGWHGCMLTWSFSRWELLALGLGLGSCDLGYESWSQKTRVPGLLVCVNRMILGSLVLMHYQSMPDMLPIAKLRSSLAECNEKKQ